MSEVPRVSRTAFPAASHVLGSKLDSIPFSPFHLGVIFVLGFVALVNGYDGSMTGTLLVLAKKPLHITPGEIRLLAVASSLAACVGGFTAAAISDHWSRRTVMLLGVAAINFFTLLIPLAQSGEHLIIIRLMTGLAIGFAASAPFPIAAELMPAQHRRTFGAIYEMMLASSFTLVPLVPLHRGFDGLLVVSAQGRQSGGVDEHFDAAGDARLSSDEPGALEREDHLVDRRRADMESALQIGFGRGATEHLSIGVDKG